MLCITQQVVSILANGLGVREVLLVVWVCGDLECLLCGSRETGVPVVYLVSDLVCKC